MNISYRHSPRWVVLPVAFFALALASAQDPDDKSGQDHDHDHDKHAELAAEVAKLRTEVARLQVALESNHSAPAAADSGNAHQTGSGADASGMQGMSMGGMKMGMGMGKGGMGGMNMGGSDSGGMQMGMGMGKGGMGGMGGMNMGGGGMNMDGSDSGGMQMGMGMGMMKKGGMMGGKGMMMMGKSPDASMNASALPGFPGASHIYHIGSSEFFLDHGEHIGLTPDQQRQLNEIKAASVLEQNEFDRQIERAEEELWTLTSAGEPDATAVEKKLADIGVLNAQQRLNFIRAVGKAAQVLTDAQRGLLVGEEPAAADHSAGGAHQHSTDSKP